MVEGRGSEEKEGSGTGVKEKEPGGGWLYGIGNGTEEKESGVIEE